VFDIVANVLYVLRKPLLSAGLVLMQMIFLIIPLIYIGSYFYGIKGIFIGLVVANIISGTIGYLVLRNQLKNPITGA
jgi:Na+-driven multidrug efflux pump